MDWFTVERLDPDTYVISEYGHDEETHCYLLLGGARALLIDTGLGVSDIGAVVRSLTELPVTVCTTHVHWDHIGGHAAFSDHAVFASERDWLSGQFPLPLSAVKAALLRKPCVFPPEFSPDAYRIYDGGAETVLHDGDMVSLGGRQLTVLHTPGHSPGHVCYFEPARGYLFSGDLLYAGTLDAFYPTTDPFAFRESVKRVRALPIRRILPGHHRSDLPSDFAAQVACAFDVLYEEEKLGGHGCFAFDGFRIHI